MVELYIFLVMVWMAEIGIFDVFQDPGLSFVLYLSAALLSINPVNLSILQMFV